MDKFLMHRIKIENGATVAGIEVHDTRDAAVRSFHAYMKQGFGNPELPGISYVACWVETPQGEIDPDHAARWSRPGMQNQFFLHHTRMDGESFAKAIDTCADMEEADRRFHAEMEYGYGNPKFAGVGFVSCMITELLSSVILKKEAWTKPEEEPAPEPADNQQA